MCIIVAKPSGVKMPDLETFRNCEESNRDGIGFSYSKPGEMPIILKGINSVKNLNKTLNICNIGEEHNLIVHFRFATHGAKDKGNCHPFPLTDDYEKMRQLRCVSECAIAHNGVFSDLPRSKTLSDTVKFISGILATPGVMENIETKGIQTLIKGYCGFSNKLAILRPKGITLIGNFEEEDGVSYSNRQYKKWTHNGNYFKNKSGQNYCYRHKIYDNCEWCAKHVCWDECEHTEKEQLKKEVIDLSNKQLDFKPLNKHKCLWCEQTEDTHYSEDGGGYLCEACDNLLSRYGTN